MAQPTDAERRAAAARYKKRYEELRAFGQGAGRKSLPELTPLASARPDPGRILSTQRLPAGAYTFLRVERGCVIALCDIDGKASPSIMAWRADDRSERINIAETAKIQWSAGLRRGRVILSDMGHVMFSVIEDTSGAHDCLMGGTGHGENESAGGDDRGTARGNFLISAAKLGLDKRDLAASISFFAPVAVEPDGHFSCAAQKKHAGDTVELLAGLDLMVAISNSPHPLMPDGGGPVELMRLAKPTATDPCRGQSAEIDRAFALTDRSYSELGRS